MAKAGAKRWLEELVLFWSLVAPNAVGQSLDWMKEMFLEGHCGGSVCSSRKVRRGILEEKRTGVSLPTDFAGSSSAPTCIFVSDSF